ncbi:MAG: amino acid ABC transporter permease [Gemmatales bacterium]|nr:MAG: amino acid ABC transporter permease [Gemmatales bacterium]
MKPTWLIVLTIAVAAGCAAPDIRIGSKRDVEGEILGVMFAQLAQSTGASVEYQRLGGTEIVWQALISGDIDAYPEYTGTLTRQIFSRRDIQTEDQLRQVLAEYGIRMSKPLGFNNTYAIGMQESVAEKLKIRKISDLRQHPDLKFGFTNEFLGRADGWQQIKAAYKLPQQNVIGMQHAAAYQALLSGDIAATDLYSTDPDIRQFHLRVLQDDLEVFPQYKAVLLYRQELQDRHPRAIEAMLRLEGRISEEEIIEMNRRRKIDREPPRVITSQFLERELGIRIGDSTRQIVNSLIRNAAIHLYLVAISLMAAIVLAIPLGIAAARRPALGQTVLAVVGILQTVPSLALLVFMIPLLAYISSRTGVRLPGTGNLPAILALFLYSLLPIVRNTYVGLHEIPVSLRESAQALGLPAGARLWLIELPLATRTILAGIKTAAVINVGTATIGALVGAGGFGQPILTGLNLNDSSMVFWQGALPAACLALIVQGIFEIIERAVVPKGLRLSTKV